MKGISLRMMITVSCAAFGSLLAQQPSPYQSSADFTDYAKKLRESALKGLPPMVIVPTEPGHERVSGRYPWKTGIVTTVFWVGRGASDKSQGGQGSTDSAWDTKWVEHYGGYDDPNPSKRKEFAPAAFIPKLNPFYIALPYNDVASDRTTKPEAKVVIPWFKTAFVDEGKSVCRDRWVAIRNAAGKVCYAQWSDSGPHGSDHWQYVFGNEKPKPNANGGAGLNVSPAVRAYLELQTTDVTDWKFVEFKEVPKGPWALYGLNNPFVQNSVPPPPKPEPATNEPTVIQNK
jgi:hypothetical protein